MAAVERKIVFEAPAAEVWAALTEAERLREWFAHDGELDSRPGGRGTFRWDDGSVRHAVVEEVEEGRLLAFRWSDDEGRETRVELALEEAGDGTRLNVTETCAGPRASAL